MGPFGIALWDSERRLLWSVSWVTHITDRESLSQQDKHVGHCSGKGTIEENWLFKCRTSLESRLGYYLSGNW